MNDYTAIYDYHDENGTRLYRIVRTSDKKFFAQRSDGNGNFTNGIDSVRRVIYRLPGILFAISLGETIYIAEGEKDADNLWGLGLFGSTNTFGAESKWLDEYTESLKGVTEVVLLPDNDAPGRKHMAVVAASLLRAGIKVKRLDLPGLKPKGDVSDWLANGGNKEKLLELVASTDYLSGNVTDVTDVTDPESPTDSGFQKDDAVTEVLRPDLKNVTRGTSDYEVDDKGVWYRHPPDENKNVKKDWICSPLLVERDTRDDQGKSWGRLVSFLDREGREHKFAVPMEEFKGSGESARGELLHNGLRIAQGRSAREHLSNYIQNAPTKGFARCVAASGWRDNSFVLPDGTVIGEPLDNSGEIIILQTTTAVQHGVAVKGTLHGWKEKQGEWSRGNSRLIGAINGALAAPLLKPLDQEPGGINFKDDSSIGKTTTARVAASVYGSPQYLQPWRATANGIEGTAAAFNDLPLVLDEVAQADPREIASVCYMLGNGKQKLRANKWGAGRATNDFRNFAISTSEKPLAAYMASAGLKASAGMEVRIVEIPANTGKHGIFEDLHGFTDGASFSEALKEACNENHGIVGVEYIKRVCEIKAKLPEKFRDFRDEFLKENLPDNAAPQVKRVCTRFALKAFSGELATAWDLTGWNAGESTKAESILFKAWLDSRGGGGQKERAEIIDCVRLFFEQNGSSRFEDWNNREKIVYNRAGFYKADNKCYYVLANVLRYEVLKGHDYTRAKEYLHEEGMLVSIDAATVRPSGAESMRCYCFKNVLSGDSEPDAGT